MAAAVTPQIKLTGVIPAAPHVPAGASRATINVQLPGGSTVDGATGTGKQSGFITAEVAMAAAPGVWTAAHAYTVGNQITDANGQVQQCITAGTSGSSAPTWGTGLGEDTADGSGALVWQNVGTSPIALVEGPCSVYITQP